MWVQHFEQKILCMKVFILWLSLVALPADKCELESKQILFVMKYTQNMSITK